jgi:hypothetical protein
VSGGLVNVAFGAIKLQRVFGFALAANIKAAVLRHKSAAFIASGLIPLFPFFHFLVH